jgi:hypothetical protein
MTRTGEAVVLFHSTSHAIRAEKLLCAAGIACTMIPVPRHLSSDCGICIRFSRGDARAVSGFLNGKKVPVDGPFDI